MLQFDRLLEEVAPIRSSADILIKRRHKMLEVSLDEKSKTVSIYCNRKGMSVLLTALSRLIGDGASHIHLTGPGAGGDDLTIPTKNSGSCVPELIIDYAEGD